MARLLTCGLAACQVGWMIPSLGSAAELRADQPGTYLALRGPVSVSGRAPVPIDELPEGDYELQAEGPGLPVVRGRFHRSDDGIRLRSWAGPGALLNPPGLVHLDRSEKRGWIFLGGVAASTALAISAHGSFRDAEDDIDRASLTYARAVSENELDDARRDLVLATRDRDDQEEIRNLWTLYAASTWIAAGIESWLLTAQPALSPGDAQGGYTLGVPRADSWGAALRSAVVPGAGHRYLGRNGRGNLFSLAVALGAGATILAHEDFLDARRDQARAQDDFDRAETEAELERARDALRSAADDTDEKDVIRRAVFGVTAGIYLWNIADAFAAGREESRSGSLAWSLSPTGDGLLAAASWSFR